MNKLLPRSFVILAVLGGIALLFSCENETKNNVASLYGRWQLAKGYRNLKETQTLAGTYFEFGQDGKMKTNLPVGPEAPTAYEVHQNEIRQKTSPPTRYQIQKLNDSSLVLMLEMRGMLFEMHLRRILKSKEIGPEESPRPDSGTQEVPTQ